VVPANTPATDYVGTLSSVTISPAGAVTVNFSLTDTAGMPVTGAEVKNFEFQIAKLVPATATKPAYWQSYINRSEQEGTVKTFTGGAERGKPVAVAGTPGAYTYTFCTPLAAVATFQYYGSGTEPAGSCSTTAVGRSGVIASPAWDAVRPTLDLAYNPAATTRLAILGRDGVVVNIVKDFVPASLPTMLATTAHELVTEESCGACHAESSAARAKLLFGNKGSGHLGRRYDLGTCTSCHNAASFNPELSTDAAWVSLDLKNIVHACIPALPAERAVWRRRRHRYRLRRRPRRAELPHLPRQPEPEDPAAAARCAHDRGQDGLAREHQPAGLQQLPRSGLRSALRQPAG
jgi:OmcA/MtrC family decaheme c-type cytochrome